MDSRQGTGTKVRYKIERFPAIIALFPLLLVIDLIFMD